MTDKKTRILEATEHLLARHGFDKLSIQMVSKEAGVAAGTIYRYFTDKNDLLIQLRHHVSGNCANKILSNLSDEMTPKQQFTTLWNNIWQLTISRDDNMINRDQYEALPSGNSAEQLARERILYSPILRLFDEGKEQGIFKPLASDVLSAIGLEPAVCLARKQVKGVITLDSPALNAVIDACWDAITLHGYSGAR